MSDRLCVLANGELSEPVNTDETNAENIGVLMSGIHRPLTAEQSVEEQIHA